MIKLILVIFICFITTNFTGQTNFYVIDTTGLDILNLSSQDADLLNENLTLYHKTNEDTIKVMCINTLSENLYDEKVWPHYNELLLEISNEFLSRKAKKPEEILYIKVCQATAYNNRGYIDNNKGRLESALDNYYKALSIYKESDDNSGISTCLNNISIIYSSQGEYEKSLEMLEEALQIRRDLKDRTGIALALGNVGGIHEKMGNHEKAFDCYTESLKISEEINDVSGGRHILNSLGVLSVTKGELDLAFEYYRKALKINEELGDKAGVGQTLYLLGSAYFEKFDLEKAQAYAEKAFAIAEELGFPQRIQSVSQLLNVIYSEKGEWEKAYKMYNLSIVMRDSINNNSLQQELFKKQVQFDYEKKEQETMHAHEKELAISLEREKVAEENEKRQKLMSMAIGVGLVLVLIIAGIIARSYFQKKTSNVKLGEMNNELNHSNLLITESLDYAKRIQSSILPPISVVKEVFPKSFIYFNPKDIVSGDFYWMHQEGDEVLFAVADCTGHGVPGAFMSIVSTNILNNIVSQGILVPNLILKEVGGMLIESLRQKKGDNSILDGLDISMASFNLKTKKLQFSGAHNSMYLIRNKELKEIKADRIHIGISGTSNNEFTNHEVEIQSGDMLYLFTDGYPDQKGGEKGKKLYYQPFRDILLEICDLDDSEQLMTLESRMIDWKQGSEQIDDMLIWGVKF